jgi:hypothetical protein
MPLCKRAVTKETQPLIHPNLPSIRDPLAVVTAGFHGENPSNDRLHWFQQIQQPHPVITSDLAKPSKTAKSLEILALLDFGMGENYLQDSFVLSRKIFSPLMETLPPKHKS